MQKTSRKLLLLILVVAIIAPTSLTFLGCSSNDEPEPEPKSNVDADMASYITPDAVITSVIYPRRVIENPDLSFLPLKDLWGKHVTNIGINPADIELIIMTTPSFPLPQSEPDFGIVLRMAKPYSIDQLRDLTDSMGKSTIEGRPCFVSENTNNPTIYMPDDRTILLATPSQFDAMLANHKDPKKGPVRKLIDSIDPDSDIAVVVHTKKLRPFLSNPSAMASLPPNFSDAKRLPELVNAVRIQAKVLGDPLLSVEFMTDNRQNATEVKNITLSLVNTGRELLNTKLQEARERSRNPNAKTMLQGTKQLISVLGKNLKPAIDGKMTKWTLTLPRQKQINILKEISIQTKAAREVAFKAGQRVLSSANLRQIAIAMQNYECVFGHYPQRANFDKNGEDGKPLLSWRVHILPFIEEEALYDQFHLNEPWDSPHNKKLIESMPDTYRNPNNPAPTTNGLSDYVVPTGPGSIFEGHNKTRSKDIIDGISRTILAVEINPDKAVTWTKPDDLQYDTTNPKANLGKANPGGFNAAFADGSVLFLPDTIDPKVLLQLFQRNDGELFNKADLQ